jgi:hypothetical protein
MKTSYGERCEILSDLWMNYRESNLFREFANHHDAGLPLAHFISEKVVESTDAAAKLVNQTWQAFIDLLGIIEQEDFPSGHDLDEILESLLLDESDFPPEG